jgi:cytochrome c oxidase subunit 1
MAPLVIISVIGGLILLTSAIMLITVLVRSQLGEGSLTEPLRYALAVNPPREVPASLNGFALWNTIVLVLMLVAYGYPIGQFFFLKSHSVPAVEVTRQSIYNEER